MALTGEQKKVLQEILRAADDSGANRTQRLAAVSTGLVESNLRNLAGGSGTSVGWRQETASSYPNVNRRDVYAAARRFFNESKPMRDKLRPGALAQAVQRSAYPGRYAQHTKEAASLLKQFGGTGSQALKGAAASAKMNPNELAAKMSAIISQGTSAQDPYEQYLETVKSLNEAASGKTQQGQNTMDPYGVMGKNVDLSQMVKANNDLMALFSSISKNAKGAPTTPSQTGSAVTGEGVEKAISWAASKLGFNEHGTNRVPWLGVNGAAWCGYFATTAARKGGAKIPVLGYVPDIAAAAQGKRNGFTGWSSGTRNAKPGDLAVIHTASGPRGHVGLVVGVNKDGSINTIEGNWSDGVARVKRSRGVTGIAHVGY